MIYLIGGLARSGKTLIRKRILKEYKISGIGTDSIRYMLSYTNPVLGINYKKPATHNGPLMWPYLDNLLYELREYSNEDFVIEGDILLPKYLSKYSDTSNIKCCYIGYSNASLETKYREIVDNRGQGDWTKEYKEREFKKFIKSSIKNSKKYEKECKRLGIRYFNTGVDFQKSIDNIIVSLMD